ncbi:SPFH domain-containing protein [Xylanibacter muris]|uniref:SPFH domain-containing protein n=1 Tax=Xylanibacter muris TaxID=2736290 RepID=A0ABX2AP04_9BACT|nr:SPFH domain-containing protein [Xylanibacter muris]NPD91934.1 SPFH domain-containing protein [Xylanibacter muris]
MESKEFKFNGATVNGFAMLFLNIAMNIAGIASIVYGAMLEGTVGGIVLMCLGIAMLITTLFIWGGFIKLEPGEARVMVFFGKYRGTFTDTGYFWVNPFITTKKLSLRARNLDADPIKVNDKTGNPVMIGMVLVWKLHDTYKAMFEIDSQTMAQSSGSTNKNEVSIGTSVTSMMSAFENFVRVQSDAALRQVAGQYAYDDTDSDGKELTLRSGGEEINQQLEQKLDERLAMAGIEIVEARINYLAYAPEIAAVMLRRQQATAIISAREKIVEGAVSMVKMALNKLSDENIVELDDDKKAAMVSNLLVVLCGDESAQPVVNTGTLNH